MIFDSTGSRIYVVNETQCDVCKLMATCLVFDIPHEYHNGVSICSSCAQKAFETHNVSIKRRYPLDAITH